MVRDSVRGRLARPSHDDVWLVALIEGVPVLSVPGIVERLHQLHVALLGAHGCLLASAFGSPSRQLTRLPPIVLSSSIPRARTSRRASVDADCRGPRHSAYGTAFEDYAMAFVDELETPEHLNSRFAVGC
jgi:hypothetical protein